MLSRRKRPPNLKTALWVKTQNLTIFQAKTERTGSDIHLFKTQFIFAFFCKWGKTFCICAKRAEKMLHLVHFEQFFYKIQLFFKPFQIFKI